MKIIYVGNYTSQTPSHNLDLNNILHVPSTHKNLLSIHRLTTDNPIFIEYHSRYFLVMDQATRKVLLHGNCEGVLYPCPSLEQSLLKCVFMITKPSVARWHDRLGHLAMAILSRVMQENKLTCSPLEYNKKLVCDVCQQGKSHQLVFPKSVSVSRVP
jgi:hypothetical protein